MLNATVLPRGRDQVNAVGWLDCLSEGPLPPTQAVHALPRSLATQRPGHRDFLGMARRAPEGHTQQIGQQVITSPARGDPPPAQTQGQPHLPEFPPDNADGCAHQPAHFRQPGRDMDLSGPMTPLPGPDPQ